MYDELLKSDFISGHLFHMTELENLQIKSLKSVLGTYLLLVTLRLIFFHEEDSINYVQPGEEQTQGMLS